MIENLISLNESSLHILSIRGEEMLLPRKQAREKQQITHKGIPIRITGDFSIEILQARKKWQDILRVMREKPTTQMTVPSKDLIHI